MRAAWTAAKTAEMTVVWTDERKVVWMVDWKGLSMAVSWVDLRVVVMVVGRVLALADVLVDG